MEATSIEASPPSIFLLLGSKPTNFKLNNTGQNTISTSFCLDSDNIQNISFSLDREYDTNLMIMINQTIHNSSTLPSYSKTDITRIWSLKTHWERGEKLPKVRWAVPVYVKNLYQTHILT